MRATRKRLNVLHVATINKPITSHMGYGPIETVIYNIDKGLTALGHRSIVACFRIPPSPARSTGPFHEASVTTSAKTRGRGEQGSINTSRTHWPGPGEATSTSSTCTK